MVSVLIALLALTSAWPAARPERVYRSPDGRLVARVVDVGSPRRERGESRVEIRGRDGRLLRSRSFASPDGEHGFGVDHCEWTADGRWFVFNVSSSGGHMPWNRPTYAYDGRAARFYNLDDSVGPVTSDFKLLGSHAVALTRMNRDGTGRDEPVVLRLSRLRRGGR